MPKKAVLDANVWVSYFINSRADYLIRWIVDHPEIIFYTCKKVNADYLITSDKQLLNFIPPFSLPIITFNQLRTLYV